MLKLSTMFRVQVRSGLRYRSNFGGVAGIEAEEGQYMTDGLLQFDTLLEVQKRSADQWPTKPLFGTYNGGRFDWMTYSEFDEKVNQSRALLADLGVKRGDTVGVISNNRWEWSAVASACHGLSAVMVPMYEAQLPKDWSYILNDAGCKALFVANDEIFARAGEEVKASAPGVKSLVSFESSGEGHCFATNLARVKGTDCPWDKPTPSDLANLIYTSGTTGKPKGVELTHSNQATNITSVRAVVENPLDFMRHDDKSLSFLPWAHSYGQTCELYSMMAHGAAIGICRGVPDILEDMELVQPTLLFSVPTLYKKVFDGVHNMIETTNPIRRTLMSKALELGEKKVRAEEKGGKLGSWDQMQFDTLDGLVLEKIRGKFGGKLRVGFVAGAACPPEIINFMDSIGVPVCEGYGLTETSPVVSMNSPEQRKVGTVGKPTGGVEVVAVDVDGNALPQGSEGEICVIGPNVMKGYHNKVEATEEVITIDVEGRRMFHTGDLGRVDEDGFVKITGRLKEQFKLENGKYVVPTPVEEAIGMSRFIEQIVLCGANRPHNVCLIVPNVEAVREVCKVPGDIKDDELAGADGVKELIDREIEECSKELKKFEVPTNWCFVEPFTVENFMLTPKMSVRRHVAIRAYEEEISAMYGDN